MKLGYGTFELDWSSPPDADFDHVKVMVSTSVRKPASTVVYTGRATRYLNKHFRNGSYYRYTLIAFDHAGNASRAVSKEVKPSALLGSPRDNRFARSPLTFAWAAVPKATYYNLQLFFKGRKVLSTWPVKAKRTLGGSWSFGGHAYRLKKGTYTWFVWPGFGPRAKGKYGQMVGQATFKVR
jgi:hypothetical protein